MLVCIIHITFFDDIFLAKLNDLPRYQFINTRPTSNEIYLFFRKVKLKLLVYLKLKFSFAFNVGAFPSRNSNAGITLVAPVGATIPSKNPSNKQIQVLAINYLHFAE